jgi:hypothetical protein
MVGRYCALWWLSHFSSWELAGPCAIGALRVYRIAQKKRTSRGVRVRRSSNKIVRWSEQQTPHLTPPDATRPEQLTDQHPVAIERARASKILGSSLAGSTFKIVCQLTPWARARSINPSLPLFEPKLH